MRYTVESNTEKKQRIFKKIKKIWFKAITLKGAIEKSPIDSIENNAHFEPTNMIFADYK